MTVSWNFPDRLGALLLCRAITNASIKQWKFIKAGEKVLELSEREVKTYEKKGDRTSEKKYELDEQFVTFLRERIKELDKKNMIPSALLPLAERLGVE